MDAFVVLREVIGRDTTQENSFLTDSGIRLDPSRMVHVGTERIAGGRRRTDPMVVGNQVTEIIFPQFHPGTASQQAGDCRAHRRLVKRGGRAR